MKKTLMKAKCPVCHSNVVLEEDAKAFLSVSITVPWFLSHPQLLEAVVKGEFQDSHSKHEKIHWACDNCLKNGKALLADPTKQTFVDFVPYYGYFDLPFVCDTCGKDFVFPALEQRYWYENLKFWVQSKPKNCADCRRKKREAKHRIKNDSA